MTRPLYLAWFVAALLSAAAIFAAFQMDAPINSSLAASHEKKWKKSADYKFQTSVRKYGDWPELMLVGAAGFIAAWRLRKRRWMHIFAAAMIASTVAGLLANASRLTTGRTRPRESPKIEQGFYGPYAHGKWLIGDSAYNSFPSGHTATAFGFAAVILFASPPAGIIAMGIAAMIAWASIVIGAHHPSDITVSIILSLVVAWFTWRLLRPKPLPPPPSGPEIPQ